MDANAVRAKHKEFIAPSVINYFSQPLVVKSASGMHVTDAEGRVYLDFFGGIVTVSLGHCHPTVNAKVIDQIGRLQHVSTLFQNEPMVHLAESLSRTTHGRLKKWFFTNSGTEADETAVALARAYTGRQEVVALRHGYSGRSLLAQSLTGHAAWRSMPTMVAGIKHAHAPYCYRCPMGLSYPACDLRCARDLEELIQTETTGQIAAFLAEPVLGVGGFVVPPKEYFKVAVEVVRKHGGVFICDEVQTGFGRTGGRFWGIEHFGVEPEIMTMAKGIANGFPMGATVTNDEIAASFKALTISTFGGNPVSCAAALATLEVMRKEDIALRSLGMGEMLRRGLDELQRRHKVIGDVRGLGLMQALELVEDPKTRVPAPARAAKLLEKAREEGLLLGKGGLYGNVIRISPPMLLSASDVDEAIDKLDRALAAC